MNLGSSRQADEPDINLVSLIDVLFCLILFLVLTTSFNQRTALKVELPKAQAGTVADQAPPLIVLVDAEGRYVVGNTELTGTDIASLKEALVQAAAGARDQPVILRADARTPHQSVVTAMDALGQLGFTRLRIATAAERKP
jgi:biopolymer transport protein ExbD